jgi:hypothetical protein
MGGPEASIPANQRRQAAECIRREWPRAMILLLGDSAEGLYDPLYDQRVPSSATPHDLFIIINRLATQHRMREAEVLDIH